MVVRYKIFQLDKVTVPLQSIDGLVRVDLPSFDKEEDAKKALKDYFKNFVGQFVILPIYTEY